MGVVCFLVMRVLFLPLLGLSPPEDVGLSIYLWFGFLTAAAFLVFQKPLDVRALEELRRQARELPRHAR
ncbi:MAG: hypothetical protein ACOZIN_19925 [Myxococcota bacterium]